VIAYRNSLAQGPVAGVYENLIELDLPNKKDVDQRAVVVVDVGEHTDFVKQFVGEALGLIDDDKQALLRIINTVDEFFEFDQKIGLAVDGRCHSQFTRKDVEKIQKREAGVLDGCNGDIIGKACQKASDQNRLAGTDIACQKQEPLVFEDAVSQNRQTLLVLFAQPKKVGVWLGAEGASVEAEVLMVHGGCLYRRLTGYAKLTQDTDRGLNMTALI